MKNILLFRREHILDLMKANMRSYALAYCAIRNEIAAAPRYIYRNILRDLSEEVDVTGYDMSRADDASLTRMTTLYALWQFIGNAEIGHGYSLNVEDPQEMIEAAKLLIPIAERYMLGETEEGDLDKCAEKPPVRLAVLGEEEITEVLLSHRQEYDAEMDAAFAMASQDKKAFAEYARQLEEKTGVKFAGTGGDLMKAAFYASRAAALAILSLEDTDTYRVSVESCEALDAGVKAFNVKAGIPGKETILPLTKQK